VLFAHLQETPPDLTDVVPAAVGKAINRALEKEPGDRPNTASGYISAIARAAGI
jgi:hypothetical protein